MLNDYEVWKLPVGTLEFYNSTHQYIFDGLELPSITQILKIKFGGMYNNVSKAVLERAAERGTKMHEAIQRYEENDFESTIIELENYKFLKSWYKWEVKKCEIPVVLFLADKPIAAGRLDLLVEIDNELGIFDIKRTSVFNKDYVAYQTNLYRIAYRQTYGDEPTRLGGIHLREEKRRFIPLPVDENMAWRLIHEYLDDKNKTEYLVDNVLGK